MSVLDHPVALESDKARALLKAMADPLRLQVLEALGGGELTLIRWEM